MADRVVKVWIYNTTIVENEPHILLAKRLGSEAAFWHVITGFLPMQGNIFPPPLDFIQEARRAVLREATLRTRSDAVPDMVFFDRTSDSDWSGVPVWHIVINHGPLDALLPVKPQLVETPDGLRGPVDLAWARFRDIEVVSQPRTGVNPAAHQHVFYKGMPLRSMVAKQIAGAVIPRLARAYGPIRDLQRFTIRIVTAQPERSLRL